MFEREPRVNPGMSSLGGGGGEGGLLLIIGGMKKRLSHTGKRFRVYPDQTNLTNLICSVSSIAVLVVNVKVISVGVPNVAGSKTRLVADMAAEVREGRKRRRNSFSIMLGNIMR